MKLGNSGDEVSASERGGDITTPESEDRGHSGDNRSVVQSSPQSDATSDISRGTVGSFPTQGLQTLTPTGIGNAFGTPPYSFPASLDD